MADSMARGTRSPEKHVAYRAEPVQAEPVKVQREVVDPINHPVETLLIMIRADFKRAMTILARLPDAGGYMAVKMAEGETSGPLSAKWLGTKAEWIDRPNEVTEVRPALPSARDITFMDRMMGLVCSLTDVFERQLVLHRAGGRGWKEIGLLDVQGRKERQLRNLHSEALMRLVPEWLEKVKK